MLLIDITGEKFGRLTVIRYAGQNRTSAQWECECDCGNRVIVTGTKLRNGHTKSCSCLQKQIVRERRFKHGLTNTAEYTSWQAMKERCSNPNSISFQYYGPKGITVCDKWKNSFEAFLEDMGKKPDPTYTIERKNNNLGYNPENCIWASKKVQGGNTSRNRWIEFNGSSKILADWIELFGITPQYFYGLERKLGEYGAIEKLMSRCQ